MRTFKIEICCGSAEDVILAHQAGADRVELVANMFQGGLTPTAGTLRVIKERADIPVMCMIRPREGGFCYTPVEFDAALADAEILLENGGDGLVFGFLKPDGTVDLERCRRIQEVAGGRTTVFHRAIDVVPDWRAALAGLIDLGITRVLTSGRNPSAYFGADLIAEMVRFAAGRIEILPGAGIKTSNAGEILQKTGCDQVHMSMHKVCYDHSTQANPDIHFGGALYPPEDRYKIVDRDALSRFTGQAAE